MIKPDDLMTISITLQDYDKQLASYHFFNWELAELERCEKVISEVVGKYEKNIPDLAQLISKYPKITDYISKEKLEEVKAFVSPQKEETVFYSFDGKTHSTLEEAAAANELLCNTQKTM